MSLRATPTRRWGQRSGAGAVNPGTRREAGERDTEASDRRCGEEVATRRWWCDGVRVGGVNHVFVFFSLSVCFSSGGVSHGPRGPTSYYYMLPIKVRVHGLKVALSSKATQVTFCCRHSHAISPGGAAGHAALSAFLQSFLYVVDSLNIPTPDSQYLLDLVRHRHWGESVLMVDMWVIAAAGCCNAVHSILLSLLNCNQIFSGLSLLSLSFSHSLQRCTSPAFCKHLQCFFLNIASVCALNIQMRPSGWRGTRALDESVLKKKLVKAVTKQWWAAHYMLRLSVTSLVWNAKYQNYKKKKVLNGVYSALFRFSLFCSEGRSFPTTSCRQLPIWRPSMSFRPSVSSYVLLPFF